MSNLESNHRQNEISPEEWDYRAEYDRRNMRNTFATRTFWVVYCTVLVAVAVAYFSFF